MKETTYLNEEFEVVEVCDKVCLFSNFRVKKDELPEGVQRYELREGNDGNFCGIERDVVCNFGGTILTKEVLDLGEDNYISFTDDTSPNFLGDEITLQEYLDEEEEEIVKEIRTEQEEVLKKMNNERITKFNEENKPFYITYNEADDRYSLCLFLSEDEIYGKEAFEAYAQENGETVKDEDGFYRHGNGYEWEYIFKKAFKGERRLKEVSFDSEADAFFCNSYSLMVLEEFGKRFKAICEDTEKFIPIVSAGIKESQEDGMGGMGGM